MPKQFSPDGPPSTTMPHGRDAGANLHPLLRLQRAAGNNAISGLMVQRREVQQSAMGRLWQRVTRSTPTLPPQDWFYLDRLHWQAYPDPMQSPFVRACLYNTQNHRPQEYETVRQRHDYYRAMSWVLQHGPGMPPGVQAIRFFDATAAVTDSPGVGTVEAPAGALISAEARRVLVEVNEILLDVNMRVINRVMASSSLVDPRDETAAPTGGMEFDLRMVETEQARVERYLTEHPAEIAQVRNELNDLVNDTRGTMLIEPIHITWAKAALGVTRLLFSEQSHRIAIGKAMVFMLHRRQQAEYTRYIQTGQREYRPTPAR